ncbi:MAG: hypothetical protein GW762_04540 [Candidatus Pacebacteria bacterium]|nr:hypothetical protein [Candidatus Paceibacterota bacterium]PIR63199.1 MAG: hypothetical protein COU64_05785 [Candidatus Pacebacteria bacterium CG10_big_fil_rev_8_21_14_0_10_40_26]PIZ78229.1 MAG: hypothetical protein COY01_05605 [Candidatus Pacebacteria bacterium CG_4_10_14_0_2_um_filter_40_20]PJA68726.1 MAG: hypothetical protein CO156_04440 [Candidatus Pacebacteria bacterium CG_4_9_14_3_um_filter_40_12]PJC41666.1 MAG: hypothetical protein CO041_03030 [Candidatus Pacebacteria bacterium CG_4_9_
MTKILLLNDIHLGISRNSTTHGHLIRQANTQAQSTLEALIPHFNSLNFDLVVHLGDALRDTYDFETDAKNMISALNLINQITAPAIHLLGNHELNAFTKEQITTLYSSQEISPEFLGSKKINDIDISWLDLNIDQKKITVPQKTLSFLKNESPTILFSHFSLIPIDPKGSFYFENEPEGMYYANGQDILDQLSEKTTVCINAHVHLLTHTVINNRHFISCPAFSENIAAQEYPQNNPGVYSILEVTQTNFCLTSYSGDFCFAKLEGTLR